MEEEVEELTDSILSENSGETCFRVFVPMKSLERFQPKGETWQSRALKRHGLQAVLAPADYVGRKNEFIDTLQKIVLSSHLSFAGEEQILDFGAGIGRLTPWLSARASLVVGIDITKQMLHKAKKLNHYKNAEFLLCDGTNTPFREGIFDVVLSVGVLQYFPDEDLKNAAKHLIAQLKKGGKIFLIEQVSNKTQNRGLHRLPKDYVEKFKGCRCVVQKPLRRCHSSLQRMILPRFVPRIIFSLIARLELIRAQREMIAEREYFDHLFIFEKVGKRSSRFQS